MNINLTHNFTKPSGE